MNNSSHDADVDGRASAREHVTLSREEMIAMIRHNLAAIKREMAAGTRVDPKVVAELEARLALYDEQHSTRDERSR